MELNAKIDRERAGGTMQELPSITPTVSEAVFYTNSMPAARLAPRLIDTRNGAGPPAGLRRETTVKRAICAGLLWLLVAGLAQAADKTQELVDKLKKAGIELEGVDAITGNGKTYTQIRMPGWSKAKPTAEAQPSGLSVAWQAQCLH